MVCVLPNFQSPYPFRTIRVSTLVLTGFIIHCPVAPFRVGAPRGSFAAGRDAARLSYPSQRGLHSSLQSPHPVSMRLLPTSVSDQLNPIPPTRRQMHIALVAYGTPFPPRVRALRLSKIDFKIDHVLDFWGGNRSLNRSFTRFW